MKKGLPLEELEEIANIEIGEALRRTRRHYCRSLEDIEKTLRIRASQIDAIEKGDIASLPGRVYAIGFVRSYAEHLGLDGAQVVQMFKAQYMDGQDKTNLAFPVPASETKTPAVWIAIICLMCASVIILSWHFLTQVDRSLVAVIEIVPEDIQSHVKRDILGTMNIIKEMEQKPADEKLSSTIENMNPEQPQKVGVLLNILDSSWVEIKNGDGKIIVSNILEKGDQYFVPDSPGITMSLGNAGNVEIIVDGRALKPLGKSGAVRRDIPLNTEYLKTLEFQDIPEPEVTVEGLESSIIETP